MSVPYVFTQPVAIQQSSNQLQLGYPVGVTINCNPTLNNLTYNLPITGLNSDIVTNTYIGPINFNTSNGNPTNIGTDAYEGTITIGGPNSSLEIATTLTSPFDQNLFITASQSNILQIGDRVTIEINPNGGTVNIGAGDSTANMTIGNNIGPSTLNLDGIVNFKATSKVIMNQLTPNYAVVTDASDVLASLQYTPVNIASTIVSRDSFGGFGAGAISCTALAINATNLPSPLLINNSTVNQGTIITLESASNYIVQLGIDGTAFLNIQTGSLLLSTDATHHLPIYLSPGLSATWGLKVSSGQIVNTWNNTLDDGSGNMLVAGSALEVGTAAGNGHLVALGLSSSSTNCGILEFAKSGSTATSNGDLLASTEYWGVDSGGVQTRSARIVSSAIANATSGVVQSQLAFKIANNLGAELVPLTINSLGITLSTSSSNQIIYANNSDILTGLGPLTNGQLVIGSTASAPVAATLTAGSGVSIANAAGSITISATGSGGTITSISAGTGITLSPNPIVATGTVSLTIPVAVTSGGTGLTSTTINQILYSSAGNTIAGLATANNGVLVTSNTGVPSIGSTLPISVQTNITELGMVSVGVWNGTIIDSSHGGTGLGAPSPGYMLCGSGTPGNWAFIPAPSAEQILGTDPLGGIFWLSTLPTFVQLNISSLGIISTGTWSGTIISPTFGGSGVNNGSNTFTIGGNTAFSGSFTFTGILTGNTSVTFPTSGTLMTTAAANAASFVQNTYFGGV